MFKIKLSELFKQNTLTYTSFIFIISLFFEESLKISSGIYRISIVEIFFILLTIIVFLNFKSKVFYYLIDLKNYDFFDLLILLILFLKIIKYSLNFSNFFNLYEVLIWLYMLIIFKEFKFMILNDNFLINKIEIAFISLSILISFNIFISFIIYLLDINQLSLWIERSSTYLPYLGTSTLHITGLFSNYNQPAHLIIPGYFFLIYRIKNPIFNFFLIMIFLMIFYLIKSKVLILFFGILFIYILLTKTKVNFKKKLSILLLISLVCFYFLITHFIIIENKTINSSNLEMFKQYFFTGFSIDFQNFSIYGSLFLKLKYLCFIIADSFNFIFFNETNFYQNKLIYNFFDKYTDPHSEYFGALANYGLIGFIIFLILPFYFILNFYKNYDHLLKNEQGLIYFLIIVIFFIEGLVLDFLHLQMLWIIFAMFKFKELSHKNN